MKELKVKQYSKKISAVGRSSWMIILDKKPLEKRGIKLGDTIDEVTLKKTGDEDDE